MVQALTGCVSHPASIAPTMQYSDGCSCGKLYHLSIAVDALDVYDTTAVFRMPLVLNDVCRDVQMSKVKAFAPVWVCPQVYCLLSHLVSLRIG